MKKWLCILLCVQLLTLNSVMAQSGEDDLIKNTQNDILIVAGAGAGGAIIGLSTLSFYETPSNHIRNIWTGAAIGLIAGVIFVAYTSAQKGSEDLVSQVPSEGFSTHERSFWHHEKAELLTMQSVQFGTQFLNLSF